MDAYGDLATRDYVADCAGATTEDLLARQAALLRAMSDSGANHGIVTSQLATVRRELKRRRAEGADHDDTTAGDDGHNGGHVMSDGRAKRSDGSCRNPACHRTGSDRHRGLCSRCYEDQALRAKYARPARQGWKSGVRSPESETPDRSGGVSAGTRPPKGRFVVEASVPLERFDGELGKRLLETGWELRFRLRDGESGTADTHR